MYICMSPFSHRYSWGSVPLASWDRFHPFLKVRELLRAQCISCFLCAPLYRGWLFVLCNDFVQCTFIFQNQLMFVCSAKCVLVCEFGLYGLRPQEIQTHKLAPILAYSYVLYLILCIVLSCLCLNCCLSIVVYCWWFVVKRFICHYCIFCFFVRLLKNLFVDHFS